MSYNFKDWLKKSVDTGPLFKLVLLGIAIGVSLLPVLSIQGKLHQSVGNQPRVMFGIYFTMAIIVMIFLFAILKTRPKKDP